MEISEGSRGNPPGRPYGCNANVPQEHFIHKETRLEQERDATFIIEQDIFRGPIELLYFLITQHELDISEVSLSEITDQYLGFVDIIKELDLDNTGQFLEIASTLLHIKARALFPDQEEDEDGDDFDPADELIGQLLEYKKYKLTGMELAEKRKKQEKSHSRGYREQFDFDRDEEGNPLEEVELGSMLSVFNELMAQTLRNLPEKIVYDDISVEEHITNILKKLDSGKVKSVTFTEFVKGGGGEALPSREFMCGAFIACLELTRQHQIKVFQSRTGGEIRIERMSPEERARLEKDDENRHASGQEDTGQEGKNAEYAAGTEERNGSTA